jgi:hypothetical protein
MRLSHFTLLLISLVLIACASTQATQKPLFRQIFLNEEGTFRAIQLGEAMENVLKKEKSKPKHNDLLGLVYEYSLSENHKLAIEYYFDNAQKENESRHLQAIIANIELKSEIETAQLYEEMELFLNQKYGLPSGDYGKRIWKEEAKSMEIIVSLAENKKGISLNFIQTKD